MLWGVSHWFEFKYKERIKIICSACKICLQNDYKSGILVQLEAVYTCFSINKVLVPAGEGVKSHVKHSSLNKGNRLPCSFLRGNHPGRDYKWKRENLMQRATSCSSNFSSLKSTCHASGTLPEREEIRGEKTDPKADCHCLVNSQFGTIGESFCLL